MSSLISFVNYLRPISLPLGQYADISLYRYAADTPLSASDPTGRAVWGFDFGLSGIGRHLLGAVSIQLVFDSNGTFAIQLTEEAGPGVGKGFSGFANVEVGSVPTVEDLNGYGISASGSAGPLSAAFDTPLMFGRPCNSSSLLCAGRVPRLPRSRRSNCPPARGLANPGEAAGQAPLGGVTAQGNGWVAEIGRSVGGKSFGGGVAVSHTHTLWSTNILGETGRWWGGHIYDWTH